jgi:hypothetical protein
VLCKKKSVEDRVCGGRRFTGIKLIVRKKSKQQLGNSDLNLHPLDA